MISEREIRAGESSVNWSLQKFHHGILPTEAVLGISIHPRYYHNTSVNSIASALKENDGRTYEPGDISSLLQEQRDDEVSHMGYKPSNAVSTCKTTIANYTAVDTYGSGISIDNNLDVSKTNTRFAAENALIVAVNYGVAVSFSHYIPIGKTSI